MAMGKGYWLNPRNGKISQVDTHDAWIREKTNADSIGLSPAIYNKLMQYPYTEVDAIRLTAMEGGLVRIRQYGSYTSCQFMAQRYQVHSILWELVVALKPIVHPDERLQITNFYLKDQVDITFGDLLEKLKNEQPVMMESDEPTDISLNSISLEPIRQDFEAFVLSS